MKNREEIDRLRARRLKLAQDRKHDHLRATHGETLVSHVASAIRKPLLLQDFVRNKAEPFPIVWPPDIRRAPGHVLAYVSRAEASHVLACIRGMVTTLSGQIGFHDTPYLGYASVGGVDPVDLLVVAESTESSVVFYTDSPAGVLMVDCYVSGGSEPFSIVVQGADLAQRLSTCFQAVASG